MSERILVVEDEATLRTNLQRYLEKLGHVVTNVGDGEEALARLGASEFDVVLTDLQLPGVDGLAVLDLAVLGGGRAAGDDGSPRSCATVLPALGPRRWRGLVRAPLRSPAR